jgi:uncharacterized protein YjbI with pentapeptide repeats
MSTMSTRLSACHPLRRPGVRGLAAGWGLALAVLFAVAPARAADCSSMAAPSIDWTECDKRSLILRGMDLGAAVLVDTDLSSTDLRGVNLAGANLEKATLVRASLAGAKADKANFARVEAYRTNLSGLSAKGSSFASAELQRADFTGADLTGADFQKAELGRANFASALLTGSRFTLANLSRADIHSIKYEGPIDFSGAFLFLTRIEGMDLTAATGLTQPQVDLACGDEATRLPEGLRPGPAWPCEFGFD